MKYFVISFLIFILCPSIFAAQINKFDGSKFHLKFGVEAPGFDIEFASRNAESGSVKLSPNLNALINVGFSVTGWGGISWGFGTHQSEEDKLERGRTDFDDYRFNFAFDRFLVSVNYSSYEGLYLKSSPKPHTLYPEMNLSNYGIHFTYVLDPDSFSLPAMLDQNQRQESSGGSWILASSFEEIFFDNNGNLILPVNANNPFKRDQNMTEAKFQTINFYGGGGYTFAFEKAWYISGYLLVGVGIEKAKVSLLNDSYKTWEASSKGAVSIALGYNGLRYFSGLHLYANGTNNRTDDTRVDYSLYSTTVSFGIHF